MLIYREKLYSYIKVACESFSSVKCLLAEKAAKNSDSIFVDSKNGATKIIVMRFGELGQCCRGAHDVAKLESIGPLTGTASPCSFYINFPYLQLL